MMPQHFKVPLGQPISCTSRRLFHCCVTEELLGATIYGMTSGSYGHVLIPASPWLKVVVPWSDMTWGLILYCWIKHSIMLSHFSQENKIKIPLYMLIPVRCRAGISDVINLPTSSWFVLIRDESKWSALDTVNSRLDIWHQQKLAATKAHRSLVSGRHTEPSTLVPRILHSCGHHASTGIVWPRWQMSLSGQVVRSLLCHGSFLGGIHIW